MSKILINLHDPKARAENTKYFHTKQGILFIGIAFLIFYVSVGTISAANIYVPDNYTRIQWAIDNATTGDTIIVRDGTYTENVDVNQRLTIQSENGSAYTIVQAANSDHVFEVTADYVNISGFTVKNATGSYKAGICLDHVHHCNISDNNVTNNYYGVYLDYSGDNTITNNNVNSNDFDGIRLSHSSNNNITNNIANSNNKYGICLCDSSNNTLTNNMMSENDYNFGVLGGIDLSDYIHNIDTSNTVDGKPIYYWINQQNQQIPDDAGYVGVVNSTNITVKDLTLTNNVQGVLFAHTSNSRIENLNASSNDYGIYLPCSSNYNTLTNNTASNNRYGIHLYSSSNNLIFHNNLINNSPNAYDTNPAKNDWHHPVLLEGNYWSDYTGLDNGNGTGKHAIADDGIGDTDIPHPAEDYDFYPFMNESLWNNAKVSIETATGTGTVTLSTSGGYFSYVSAVNESSLPSEGKPDIVFPYGFFSFNIAGLNYGDNLTLTIELPNELPTNSQYWKYGANGSNINPQPERWYQIPMGSNDGDNVITIQFTDGEVGDDDGIANGVIIDQGGPALIPDLTLNSSDISFSPASPTEDDSVTITATVHNVGGADANNFTVSFFDGTSLIGNDTISVSVNSTSSASIIWTAVLGDHNIKVVADAGNVIVESNETDNEAYKAITVKKKTVYRPGGGGGRAPCDSDGDGYSDIEEMLAGTDPYDPCDPNPECAACLASKPLMPTPTPPVTPTLPFSEMVDEELKKLSEGLFLFNTPEKMKVWEKERVVVRITKNITEDLTKGLKGREVHDIEKMEVNTFMEVCLTGDNFDIRPLRHEKQVVGPDVFTQWEWDVTPLEPGNQTLNLLVTVRIKILGHPDEKRDLTRDRHIDVEEADLGDILEEWFKSNFKWIVGVIALPIIIAIMTILFGRHRERRRQSREEEDKEKST